MSYYGRALFHVLCLSSILVMLRHFQTASIDHMLCYAFAFHFEENNLFTYTSMIMPCHTLAIAWSNNSLFHFAVIEMHFIHST